ncbi:MAG: hypothetical protein HY899_17585 [Deltaproteobacteria bacterium]|nr:hypothetical protein [Deltaproteobacteria bacterium]
MRVTPLFVIALVLGVPVGHGRAEGGAPASFDTAMTAAQANVATPEGAAFDAELGKQFGKVHENTMVQCAVDAADKNFATFNLLMELDAAGAVVRTLVRPESPVAACLQKAVAHDVYGKPPRAGYWVRAEMVFRP